MKIFIWITLVLIAITLVLLASFHKRPKDSFIIIEIPNFLSKEECDHLIEVAKQKGMEKSMVYADTGDVVDPDVRISEQTWIYDVDDEIVAETSRRIAELTNVPVENQEAMQLLHYTSGGKYNPHYDACDGDEDQCARMNKGGGPRILTFIVYLNDNFEGGETDFPHIGIKVKPEQGKAVIFKNVDAFTSDIYQESLHAGLPVKDGEKWMLNKWIHVKKYE